ncbi:hypothetical protein K504DRAFT_463109 [Pleomassaria siparia CBS 279.74]|uniref:CENP-V/GFA domain-containing protein n=1 Tax=Pleomassaria siparia CBS 279.74 TaxID=1314801 RepID=A0A6G1JUM9_9PLEO|nr:hypothetical protein K504DRAFT_463109 [Pleomassaria siparia CBS 279.74]
MPNPRPFPALAGGCACGDVRYRMETAPLYCFACHCPDCQRQSGSAFAAFAVIENDRVTSIGRCPPQKMTIARPSGITKLVMGCTRCKTIVWDASSAFSVGTVGIKVGSFDFPNLMEPDMHMYVESKVSWLPLPKDAKTCVGRFDAKEVWPKSSLARLEVCKAKFEKEQKEKTEKERARKDEVPSQEEEEEKEQEEEESQADRTPTAESPEEKDVEEQDADKEFEKRQKALEERLERLTLKISQQART